MKDGRSSRWSPGSYNLRKVRYASSGSRWKAGPGILRQANDFPHAAGHFRCNALADLPHVDCLSVRDDVAGCLFDSCRRFLTALLCASGHVLRPALGQHACFLVGVLIEQARIDVQPPCCFQHADDPRKMAHRRQFRANLLPVVHPR